MLRFCIIIPMYNEADNAERCLKVIDKFLNGLNANSSIIVVNDGSTDATGRILHELSSKLDRLIVATHETNKGYGAANITGSKRASQNGFEYALFMDADLTQNVEYIYPFINHMEKNVDYIKATRYAGNGGVEGVPFKRWVVSWVGNIVARLFLRLPLTDYTNGFRAIKIDILSRIHCSENGFAYLIEEICEASKFVKSYAEVPYILSIRVRNASESKFQYSPRVYWTYLKYLVKRSLTFK
jgi:dolichol-phosphate mannosyltransferase